MFNETLTSAGQERWLPRVYKEVIYEEYADAKNIILACGIFNAHNISLLYQAFLRSKAIKHMERIKLNHTLKHGHWSI